MRRSLNGCFVDFHLLPDLLCKTQRLDGRQQTQDCWAQYLSQNGFDGTYQALDEAADAEGIAEDAWRMANHLGLLTPDGLTGNSWQVMTIWPRCWRAACASTWSGKKT